MACRPYQSSLQFITVDSPIKDSTPAVPIILCSFTMIIITISWTMHRRRRIFGGLGVMRHAKMKNERKHYTCAARASDDNNGTLCDYNRILYGSDGNIGSTIPLS
jgi:hypothetical protein